MDMIRAFVAIALDQALHSALARVEDSLKAQAPAGAVKWVPAENIHVTLKFLGDIPAGRIEEVKGALEAALAGVPPFAFDVQGLGCFPNPRRPRVLWVGIDEPTHALLHLQARVEEELAKLGFAPEDRPFSPHLTLGRVRREARPSDLRVLGQLIEEAKVGRLGRQEVRSLSLFRSDLRPAGAVYTPLAVVPLGENG